MKRPLSRQEMILHGFLVLFGVLACCRNRGSTELFGGSFLFFLTVRVSRGYTIRRGCCFVMWSTPVAVRMTLLALSFEPPLSTFLLCLSAIAVLNLQCFSAVLSVQRGRRHRQRLPRPDIARAPAPLLSLRLTQISKASSLPHSHGDANLIGLAPITTGAGRPRLLRRREEISGLSGFNVLR